MSGYRNKRMYPSSAGYRGFIRLPGEDWTEACTGSFADVRAVLAQVPPDVQVKIFAETELARPRLSKATSGRLSGSGRPQPKPKASGWDAVRRELAGLRDDVAEVFGA